MNTSTLDQAHHTTINNYYINIIVTSDNAETVIQQLPQILSQHAVSQNANTPEIETYTPPLNEELEDEYEEEEEYEEEYEPLSEEDLEGWEDNINKWNDL